MLSLLLIHELSHLLFIKLFNQKINKLTITALGGIIDAQIHSSRIKETLIYFSGIMANILIHITAHLLMYLFNYSNIYLDTICYYNKLYIIFNILPIYPLDGFQVLDALIKIKNKERIIINVELIISITFLIIFFIYSILFKSIGLILIGIFLGYKNYYLYLLRDEIVIKKIVRNLIET